MSTSNIAGAIDALKREIEKEKAELAKVEREIVVQKLEFDKLVQQREHLRLDHKDHERELKKLQQDIQSLA